MNQSDFYDTFHQNHSAHKVTEMLHMERRVVIADLLAQADAIGSHILVVGCGRGDDTEALRKPAVALDLSPVALREARQKYPAHTYLVADAHDLPFAEEAFDIVVCSEVIEHVRDPLRTLSELRRVLCADGILVITTPNWRSFYGLARFLGELILRHPVTSGGQPVDHWYTKELLETYLNQYFEIIEWRGVWFFPPVGLGHKTLPLSVMVPLFRFLLPIEHILQRRLPNYAHVLAVSCAARREAL